MVQYTPKIPVSMAEFRGHVGDAIRTLGYFPLALRTGRPFRLDRPPVWSLGQDDEAACMFHHPKLTKWPVVTMECDVQSKRLLFRLDHWKPRDWCRRQRLYSEIEDLPRLPMRMIADEPMRFANMRY